MGEIFKKLDAILAAYDLQTAKDLHRLQKGIQPRHAIYQEESKLAPGDLNWSEAYTWRMANDSYEIKAMYKWLSVIKTEIDVLDQYTREYADKRIKYLYAKIDELDEKAKKLQEKARKIERLFTENFRKKIYEELFNAGKTDLNWEKWSSENKYIHMHGEYLEEFLEACKSDKKYQQCHKMFEKTKELEKECESMTEELREIAGTKNITTRLAPVFDIKDTSHIYDTLFETEAGSTKAQRIVPAELKGKFRDILSEDSEEISPDENYVVVISRAPYDIAGADINRSYHGSLGKVEYNESISPLITDGVLIAYVCKETDTTEIKTSSGKVLKNSKFNVNNPVGRFLILPYRKDPEIGMENPPLDESVLIVSNNVKGDFNPTLKEKIQKYLNRVWNSKYPKFDKVIRLESKRPSSIDLNNGDSYVVWWNGTDIEK